MSESLTAKAVLNELRLAPRKVSLVAGLVRGRTVEDAIVILNNTPKRAAKPLRKLLESVRANAINNHNMKSEGSTNRDFVCYCWSTTEALSPSFAWHGSSIAKSAPATS